MTPEIREMLARANSGSQTMSIYMLAEEFLQYSQNNMAASTLPARITRMRHFVRFLLEAGISEISQLNNAVLSIYFDNVLVNISTSSKNAAKAVVKAFIGWIEGYKEISTPVAMGAIKQSKTGRRNPKYIDFDKIERAINNQNLEYVDRLLVAVASMIGFRASEIANIKPCDITGDRIHVRGKGDNDGTVTVPTTIKYMIDTYRQLAPYTITDESHLFQSYWRGEWRKMTAKTIWRRIKNVFQSMFGIDTSPHPLRHSYAVHLLLSGCDIITIQKSLRHVDLKTTQMYLGIADNVVSRQIHKYLG